MSPALGWHFNFQTLFADRRSFDTALALVEAEATALLRQSRWSHRRAGTAVGRGEHLPWAARRRGAGAG